VSFMCVSDRMVEDLGVDGWLTLK